MKKIAIAYPAFYESVKYSFGVEVGIIEKPQDVKQYDLVVFPGGADINPSLYGQSNQGSWCDLHRDSVEIPIAKEALNLGKKILGLCRGHQLINVLLGGALYQEISQVVRRHPGDHDLEFAKRGILYKFFYGVTVNSLHHQAVSTRGESLVVTCLYDSLVEGTESKHIITTQFHPEFMEGDHVKKFFNFLLTEW